MTQHPEISLSVKDIPHREFGAKGYDVKPSATGGFNIVEMETSGVVSSVLDRRPSLQAAVREAIRLQKRENIAQRKRNKELRNGHD